MSLYHTPVLLEESVGLLGIVPTGTYADLTFGGGGHSRRILADLGPEGRLYAFDQDRDTRANCPEDLRFHYVESNFRFLRGALRLRGVDGVDGMMLADKLIEHFGDARVVVNDLLMHLEPLRPLWIPVNKHGSQSPAYARKFDEEFFGDRPILTFPAGLCSRTVNGQVTDPEWKISFLKKAYASQRLIVPVFVEGRLSNFFYRVYHLRKALGVKFNIEMLWLPDEMFSQKGRHFRIVVGEPIAVADLQPCGSLREQAEAVRKKVYSLEKRVGEPAKSR